MKKIETESTSSRTMDVTPILIRETSTTRLMFYPKWVSESRNPLRGGFIFEKKSKNDDWKATEYKPLTQLKKDEEYKLNLSGQDIAILFENLEEIKKTLNEYGHEYGVRSFVLNEKNTETLLLQLGDTKNRDIVIEQLKKLETENFDNLESVINNTRLVQAIKAFKTNIENDDEGFWQTFFENNSWIMQQLFEYPIVVLNGESYLGGKNSKVRQGVGGTATDFLCQNHFNKSFAVVEIKTPKSKLVGSCYRGKKNSNENNELYSMHSDLTGGIVQMENQIHVAIQDFESVIGKDYSTMSHLNPSGVLLIGSYSSLSEIQKKSFDLFRKSAGNNLIITYDELLLKLTLLKELYEI